jgi:hypothetical protein
MRISIAVHGINEVTRRLSQPLGDALTPGLRRAGVILEAGWKRRVHVVTRKAQASLGHKVEGTTLRVGPQPGFGSPRKYSKSQTSAWRKPRDGTNRGDPREYLVFEDQGTRFRPGHPAAEPALRENVDEIVDAISDAIRAALR